MSDTHKKLDTDTNKARYFNVTTAIGIYTAFKGYSPTVEDAGTLFVNAFGEVIHDDPKNGSNYRHMKLGRFMNGTFVNTFEPKPCPVCTVPLCGDGTCVSHDCSRNPMKALRDAPAENFPEIVVEEESNWKANLASVARLLEERGGAYFPDKDGGVQANSEFPGGAVEVDTTDWTFQFVRELDGSLGGHVTYDNGDTDEIETEFFVDGRSVEEITDRIMLSLESYFATQRATEPPPIETYEIGQHENAEDDTCIHCGRATDLAEVSMERDDREVHITVRCLCGQFTKLLYNIDYYGSKVVPSDSI